MEAFVKPAGAETAPSRSTRAFAAQCCSAGAIMTRDQYASAYRDGFAVTTKFLVSRGINVDTAEEAAQAAWAKGWEHRDKLRDPGKVLTWVNTIALNVFRNWFRRRETGELPAEIPVPPDANPRLIDVGSALAKCTPADREMIEKHYLAGYTSAELGQQMSCTPVAVRVRMLRVRRRLQQSIARSDASLSSVGADPRL